MKTVVGLVGLLVVLLLSGCEEAGVYGGAYGSYGEYPYGYGGAAYGYPYGYAYAYPYPYYHGPYDRDHYWDRARHWERHRWHGDYGWGHHEHHSD